MRDFEVASSVTDIRAANWGRRGQRLILPLCLEATWWVPARRTDHPDWGLVDRLDLNPPQGSRRTNRRRRRLRLPFPVHVSEIFGI